MGMFDYIKGKVTCPFCNKKTKIDEQIKWTDERSLRVYKLGSKIDVPDGDYTYGSFIRTQLIGICEHCDEKFPFGVKVENGKISNFYVIDAPIREEDSKEQFERLLNQK